MVVAFSGRPLFYQVAVLLLLLTTLAFCLGLALPWWVQTYSSARKIISSHSGLWLSCSLSGSRQESRIRDDALHEPSEEEKMCGPIEKTGWFRVVQGMQGAGLLGMVSACAYVLCVNFCTERIKYSKAAEILAGTGGLLGVISATVYVTKTSQILKRDHLTNYSWAFGIDIVSSILVLFIAVVIALTNRPPVDDEAVKVIVESCEGHEDKDVGSRSPKKTRRKREGAEVEMKRSPARTRRLEAISETFVSIEEHEEELEGISRRFSYVNSVGEVANYDPRTPTL